MNKQNTNTKNLPTVSNQKTALEILKKHIANQDLVFVNEEDLNTHIMFLPEVKVIRCTPDDFHNISGNFMPKSHQTDRIGEAAGINFVSENCGTRKEKEDVYVGFAQGKKRYPDGTWRNSSVCEYEFDVNTRAEADFAKDAKKMKDQRKYLTEADRNEYYLNLKKYARQRAGTGARLKVIRELTGMPISFKPGEIHKAMVFSRVAVNTEQLLADPEMREVAIKIALGASKEIYGPQPQRSLPIEIEVKNDEGKLRKLEAPAEEQPEPEEEEVPFVKKSPEEQEIAASLVELKKLSEIPYLHKDAKAFANDLLAGANPSLDAINGAIERIREWLNDPRVVKNHGRYKEEAVQ
jgi:hypothetical protein